MDPQWILVIVLWGGLIGVMIACLIPELKKTPEQRKKEAEMARRAGRKTERKKRERGRKHKTMHPPKGACRVRLSLASSVCS